MKENKKKNKTSVLMQDDPHYGKLETLHARISVSLFILLILSCVIGCGITVALRITGVLAHPFISPILLIIIPGVSCILVGTLLTAILTERFFSPIRELLQATREIAKGNYSVRISEPSRLYGGEFEEFLRSFNNMASELEGTELFRNDFINNFSHEFKTPIVSIRGFAKQLEEGNLTEQQKKEYLEIIVRESDRLSKMSANVLLLSKLENQQIVSNRTTFYLDEQIRQSILLLEKEWTKKDLQLDVELDEAQYTFDEEMLSRVWINLLGNAIKFTPANGTVLVRLRKTEKAITVTVSDTGIGMDEVTQKHIFDKFYQGDNSHAGEGNGIGLTLVTRILALCRGSISVQSFPGAGSTFTVCLPTEERNP